MKSGECMDNANLFFFNNLFDTILNTNVKWFCSFNDIAFNPEFFQSSNHFSVRE